MDKTVRNFKHTILGGRFSGFVAAIAVIVMRVLMFLNGDIPQNEFWCFHLVDFHNCSNYFASQSSVYPYKGEIRFAICRSAFSFQPSSVFFGNDARFCGCVFFIVGFVPFAEFVSSEQSPGVCFSVCRIDRHSRCFSNLCPSSFAVVVVGRKDGKGI